MTVHFDQAPLRWLIGICEPNRRLIRWRLRISEFNFQVVHKKGILNTQVDALFRLRSLVVITVPTDEDTPFFTMAERVPRTQ